LSVNLNALGDRQLIDLYTDIEDEFRIRKMIKGNKGLVDGLSEYILPPIYGLTINENASEEGYDAIGRFGGKYQIKGRRLTKKNTCQAEFPSDTDWSPSIQNFDYLLFVVYDNRYKVVEAYEASWRFIFSNRGKLKKSKYQIPVNTFRKNAQSQDCFDIMDKIHPIWK